MEFLCVKNGSLYAGDQPILLRGMGLGGWLLPEGYMWKFYSKCDRPRRIEQLVKKLCGAEYAASFWQHYTDNYITEADIAWLAKNGLNSARIPLNSRHLFHISAAGGVRFNEHILNYVDNCLAWCKKYNIYLFLDMHGAPGGQTGQNIDDSEHDLPELFADFRNQDMLVEMWCLLAVKYRDEAAIGGYDLLNEPITKWNSQYYSQLLPLYRRLISAIRKIDSKHTIILEGVHWATDFSVFDEFTPEEAADNILLEFHKYWSDPDTESLAPICAASRRLNVPLWMGEGGENNLYWYTYAFPMYERLGIGWCFWSYKKMDTLNSPVTFPQPNDWPQIINYLDGGKAPDRVTAQKIFNEFLDCIVSVSYNPEVICAILRKPPVEIPAAAFDYEQIHSLRRRDVQFRMTSSATLLFADGHRGMVDWRRYGGEPQPETERLLLCLSAGDSVAYHVSGPRAFFTEVRFCGEGTLMIQGIPVCSGQSCHIEVLEDELLWLRCTCGQVQVETLLLTEE